jgi:hypothetical protein
MNVLDFNKLGLTGKTQAHIHSAMCHHISRVGRPFAMMVLGLTLSGCAARYRPPAEANEQIAHLEAIAPVWIVAIDGKKLSSLKLKGEQRLRLAPGRHIVEVGYASRERRTVQWNHQSYAVTAVMRSQDNVPLRLTAEPGRTYYVQEGRIDDAWSPFFTETRDLPFEEFPLPATNSSSPSTR